MFLIALIIFLAFTLFYVVFSLAVVYHLKQYTLSGHYVPQTVTTIFFFVSGLFWLFALYFLFKIPG